MEVILILGLCLWVSKENIPLALHYQHTKNLANNNMMSLTLPYLNTYADDVKNRTQINKQIIKALAATKKDLIIQKVETPTK